MVIERASGTSGASGAGVANPGWRPWLGMLAAAIGLGFLGLFGFLYLHRKSVYRPTEA